MRTPIDILIDQAVASGKMRSAPMVTLRCPCCGRKKRVFKDRTDPKRTAYVEAPCDKCDRGGDKPETTYWDALNRQINPATGKPFRNEQNASAADCTPLPADRNHQPGSR